MCATLVPTSDRGLQCEKGNGTEQGETGLFKKAPMALLWPVAAARSE